MFNLLQLNLHKNKNATTLLSEGLQNKKEFIYLLTEPHVSGKGNLPGYPRNINIFHLGLFPRTCILASKNQNLWLNPRYSSGDITTCLWKTGCPMTPEIYICSVYLDINYTDNDFLPKGMIKLVNFCNTSKTPLIISMDCNSHSEIWGLETNQRGEILEEYIFANNLNVENVGKVPTFIGRDCETIIDITLTCNYNGIKNWKVSKMLTLSDHRPILFEIELKQKVEKKLVLDTKSADWLKFKDELDKINYELPEIINKEWLDQACRTFVNNVTMVLKKSSKYKVITAKVKKPYFWNLDIENIRKNMRSAWNRYRRLKSPQHLDSFKTLKAKFQNEVRKAKYDSWKEFTSETKDVKAMSKLSKTIQGIQNQSVGLLEGTDDQVELSPERTMNILLDTHFPGSVDGATRTRYGRSTTLRRKNFNKDTADFDFITEERVKWSFQSFGSGKAAGPDELKPIVLQHLGNKSLEWVVKLYKTSLALSYVPSIWRESKVIFIPKPGKDDYSKAKSFRPISLTSFLFKGLERVVLNEMEREYLSVNPINQNQHAFRKGSSCDSALSSMVNEIEKSILRGQYALGIFLDISGAFDNLDPGAAIRGMNSKGIPSFIVSWFGQYLNNRYITTDINGVKARRKLTKGTPQGGVLSPVVWNLAFDELLDIFKTGPVKIVGFADDAALLITGPDPVTLAGLGQTAVNKAVNWGKSNGLEFGAAKTVAVLFRGSDRVKMPEPLKVANQEIPYSKAVTYLGIKLDYKLTFSDHIRDKIKKGKGLLMKTKLAIGKLWGPSPELMRWAYTGIVRPMLSYGSIIWAHKSHRHIQALNKLQRLAMLNTTHILKSAPTMGLEVIMGLPPLDLFFQNIAAATYERIKLKSNLNWDGNGTRRRKGHLLEWSTRNKNLGIDFTLDETSESTPWGKTFTVSRNSFENGKPQSNADFICYTDGSKIANNSGWGYRILKSDQVQAEFGGKLISESTVFQTEVYAITRGAEKLLEITNNDDRIDFFVDSQAALLALDSKVCKSTLVNNCINILNELGTNCHVTLHWVQAHVGHDENERVDSVAKEGAKAPEAATVIPFPKAHLKAILLDNLIKNWNKRWENETHFRQTKLWFPEIDLNISKRLLKSDRFLYCQLIQIITGHNYLNYHQYNCKKVESPICRKCDEEIESSWHIITECPAFAAARFRSFGNSNISPEVLQIPAFLRNSNIGPLFNPKG
jgi:ribonuclease HI